MTPTSPEQTIAHDVALHCDDHLGRPMAFMATFEYRVSDPYAVSITFRLPTGQTPWALERDLLRRGVDEPAGAGAIRLCPAVDGEGRATVEMTFLMPDGLLRTHALSKEVRSFLARTDAVVAEGEELLNLEELVAELRG